jgi:nitrous oxidase accessory protein
MRPPLSTLPFAVLTLALVACAGRPELARHTPPAVAPPRPEGCTAVSSGEPLQASLNRASPGTTLCLGEGTWVGALVVPRGVGLWGTGSSVLRTDGTGTTVLLQDGTSLGGVTVDGSGGRFDVLDAAVKVHGDDVRVEGVTIRNSVFGILVEKSRRVTVRGNRVFGIGGPALGMRGDGIRLWETNDSLVEDNLVEQARDCVVWYSSRNVLRRNEVRDGRYGVHLMYSHSNRLERNRFVGNEVGMFAMYSRDLTISDNQMLFSRGSAGIGLGMKESGNLVVQRNLLIHNTQGLFLDNSPLVQGDRNLFEHNVIRLSEVGIGFLSSEHDNEFRQNVLRDNTTQVRVDGGGDALGVVWNGNEWSDYAGYDLDRDGVGDLPYELKDLSGALTSRHADLSFLRGTLALGLVGVAGEVVPLFAPKPVLRDPAPRIHLEVANAD